MPDAHTWDAVIVGGGPAGAAAARLLAGWNHRVALIDKTPDPHRGLAESIPPSTQNLLDRIGVARAVADAGFMRASGNTASWGSREQRVERFADRALGYQVFRPDFDRVLLLAAADAGAHVCSGVVRSVAFGAEGAAVHVESGGAVRAIDARFVLDCSGRGGIVARSFRVPEPHHETFALVGVWTREDDEWPMPDQTHTAVETFADGWAWSVPVDARTRHVGAMVGRTFPRDANQRSLGAAYRRALAQTGGIARLADGATLRRLWACDASLYTSSTFAGPQFFLVGDAGSFIDPLSSFGVKKALASAWMAAVAAHTSLIDPSRATLAADYFSAWERRVYASHLRRTHAFAQAAAREHRDAYWIRRASTVAAASAEGDEPDHAVDEAALRRAFESFKTASAIRLAINDGAAFENRPVIRGNEIVLEPSLSDGMRFYANVDLLALARMAPQHAQVPDLFEAYCRTCSPVPLPNVVSGLSLLVARGILHDRV